MTNQDDACDGRYVWNQAKEGIIVHHGASFFSERFRNDNEANQTRNISENRQGKTSRDQNETVAVAIKIHEGINSAERQDRGETAQPATGRRDFILIRAGSVENQSAASNDVDAEDRAGDATGDACSEEAQWKRNRFGEGAERQCKS